MDRPSRSCSDCESSFDAYTRRDFLKAAGAATVAVGTSPLWTVAAEAAASQPESIVKVLYESLSPAQREKICFNWDYQHPKMGLLRTRISNNWNITEPSLNGDFYTKDQVAMVRSIFEGMTQPE